MPIDLSHWSGALALQEVEEKPAVPLVVKYGSLEIDELGKVFTPTQVRELAANASLGGNAWKPQTGSQSACSGPAEVKQRPLPDTDL